MTANQPLAVLPFVGVGITRFHGRAGLCKRECVEPRIKGGIAADLDGA